MQGFPQLCNPIFLFSMLLLLALVTSTKDNTIFGIMKLFVAHSNKKLFK